MRRASVLLACAALAGCGGEASYPPQQLSEWGLFADGAAQAPAEGVGPYEIISPLFADYAAKHRFIRLPEGARITYTEEGDWVFPTGTVIVKTFGFLHDLRDPSAGERIVETRLLVLEEDGEWHPYVYLWDEAGIDAELMPTGAHVDVEWTHYDGSERTLEYRVPTVIQCSNCHGGRDEVTPIGPRTEQMDRDHDYGAGPVNQIDHLVELGWLEGPVPPYAERPHFEDPVGAGDLDARARGYLDANCSHCHRENGYAHQSGLWLGAHTTSPTQLGVCKVPAATSPPAGSGIRWDVVPGSPDQSFMVYRMESTEPGMKMPELPSLLSHAEGVALIREWIAAMPAQSCE